MSRQRFAMLLITALVVITGALLLTTRRNQPHDTPGVALMPALANDLNTITAVIVRKGGTAPAVTVHKTADHWTVAERADYPADIGKVRKLLLSLRDAKIVEEKTDDPARFSVIGVEDPAEPGAAGAEVTVVGPAGKHSVIVGKAVGEGNFVRRAGEKRSYSVEPPISVESEPRFWIDARLIDVPVAQIQSVDVKPAAGAAYAIHRLNADNTYRLDGVPAGRKALDEHALAPGPTTFTGLTAEDVAPSSDIDFGHASQVIVTLPDDSVMTLTGTVVGTKHWIEVKSNKDAALTAKTAGRAFEIASYRYDAIFKPLEQLLLPKEPPPTKGSPAAAPARAKQNSAPPTAP